MEEIYVEYEFRVSPLQPASDILIAELGAVGFESFVETESGVLAYIQKPAWNPQILEGIQLLHNKEFQITYAQKEIAQENWNATWESNFNPIQVADSCVVRAPFHEKPQVDYDIVIEPKMSFGTGHHQTTYMMLRFVLELDCVDKSVLDMGSGTGVLAILSAMRGANPVTAIDIDSWCFENAVENTQRNQHPEITVLQGDAQLLSGNSYDIILANINRNVLLQDIPTYASCLQKGGVLILSGFYSEDLPMISDKCASVGLRFEKNREKDNWIAAKFVL